MGDELNILLNIDMKMGYYNVQRFFVILLYTLSANGILEDY